jgi:hypothetical protein
MFGRKREFFTPPNQADPRLPAFEKYANQADCGEARFVVELLREAYVMKPRMFVPLPLGRVSSERERTKAANGTFLRQSQIPQYIEYVLRGTLDVPRTMRDAEPTS